MAYAHKEPEEPLSWAYLIILSLFCGLILLMVGIAYSFSGRSESTTFSIVAQTRVFSLRPVCGSKILWDLPPGVVDDPAVRDGKAISLGFGDDAVARVALDDNDRVLITVRPLHPDKKSSSIVVLRDGKPVKPAKESYAYRTTGKTVGGGGASGNDRTQLTLRLLGRVVIGEVLPEGAGWRKSSAVILGRGQLYGYDRALVTRERLTLVSEAIDPGAVVDTHPDMNARNAGGQRLIDIHDGEPQCASVEPAEGFVRVHQDGDLEVVVYRRGTSVGIAPLGRSAMEIGVTWWSRFIASPVVQTALTLFGVLFLAFQILTGNRRLLPWRSAGNRLKERLPKIPKTKR